MYIFNENKGNCFKEVMRQMDIYEMQICFEQILQGRGRN